MAKKKQIEPPHVQAKCASCGRITKHEVLGAANRASGDNDEIWWSEHYQIIRCLGCENIAFRIVSSNSEELDVDEDGNYAPIQHVSIYPNPDQGRQPIDDYYRLPRALREIYLETIQALNSEQLILAGIGIRAVVETICNDRKAAGNKLEKMIDDLVAQQVLTKDGARLLHKLRTMGNKAAHAVKPHNMIQLTSAMDVVNHLLLGVYIIPKTIDEAFGEEEESSSP